jgi:ribosomal protein L7Ae-like RNA K-turn-binding protein
VVSTHQKELFLQRLWKEVGQYLHPIKSTSNQQSARLWIGINACTRVLEQRLESVQLVVACRDLHPPTMVCHILMMVSSSSLTSARCYLLPGGQASLELGQALGIRRASVFLIADKTSDDDLTSNDCQLHHEKVDSFVEYVTTQLFANDDYT